MVQNHKTCHVCSCKYKKFFKFAHIYFHLKEILLWKQGQQLFQHKQLWLFQNDVKQFSSLFSTKMFYFLVPKWNETESALIMKTFGEMNQQIACVTNISSKHKRRRSSVNSITISSSAQFHMHWIQLCSFWELKIYVWVNVWQNTTEQQCHKKSDNLFDTFFTFHLQVHKTNTQDGHMLCSLPRVYL